MHNSCEIPFQRAPAESAGREDRRSWREKQLLVNCAKTCCIGVGGILVEEMFVAELLGCPDNGLNKSYISESQCAIFPVLSLIAIWLTFPATYLPGISRDDPAVKRGV